MVAVITGDIIASRNLVNQENWLQPLKSLFAIWGESHNTGLAKMAILYSEETFVVKCNFMLRFKFCVD
jgi:hypothetical protein